MIYCGPFFVDAHVHVYPIYNRERLLSAALCNFRAANPAAALNSEPDSPGIDGCIMLTETARDQAFRALREAADAGNRNTAGDREWTFEPTGEACSLLAHRRGGGCLLVVAGRQIATAEGLEVSALGIDADFPDGTDLATAIRCAGELGAVVVLPWGFGKWWGARGKSIIAAVESAPANGLFVGDSGVRPPMLPYPAPLSLATRRGIPILSGSDPLPLGGEEDRAGSIGFTVDGEIDRSRPAEGIMSLIRALKAQPPGFGRHNSAGTFLRNQVKLRFN